MDYCGVHVQVPCVGLDQMVEFSLMCAVKSAAVKLGVLATLWCQAQLTPSVFLADMKTEQIDPLLLDGASSVRSMVARLDSAPDAKGIRGILKRRRKDLVVEDLSWDIDNTFWLSRLGQSGVLALRAKVGAAFPSGGATGKPSTTFQVLEKLHTSQLAKFVPPEEKVALKDLCDMVQQIMQGDAPRMVARPSEAWLVGRE